MNKFEQFSPAEPPKKEKEKKKDGRGLGLLDLLIGIPTMGVSTELSRTKKKKKNR
tara:strand:- start:3523 stop:3687 length:165 start_codon:yes stop_codon:yes gene_type:complete